MNPTKLILIILISFSVSVPSYAAITYNSFASSKIVDNENPQYSKATQHKLALMRKYVSLSVKEHEKLSGRKMNFFSKAFFKLNQHRARKMLKMYDGDGPTTLQKIAWFLKGFVLGPIAILLAYALLKDEERELIKWTWFGFAALAVTAGIILLTL